MTSPAKRTWADSYDRDRRQKTEDRRQKTEDREKLRSSRLASVLVFCFPASALSRTAVSSLAGALARGLVVVRRARSVPRSSPTAGCCSWIERHVLVFVAFRELGPAPCVRSSPRRGRRACLPFPTVPGCGAAFRPGSLGHAFDLVVEVVLFTSIFSTSAIFCRTKCSLIDNRPCFEGCPAASGECGR